MTVAGRADPVSRHLRVGLRKAITTLHVIAAVALLGSQSALLVLALSAALTSDASLRHAGYQLMRTLVFALEIPLAVTALTSGLVLAVRTKWGVFQHYWIIGKLSLLLVTALIGIIAIRPWTEQMLTATEPQAAAQLPASRWLLAVALALAITALATATGLSVYKPRGRTRRDAAPAR